MKNFYLIFLIILPLFLYAGVCFAGGSLELTYPTIGGNTLTIQTDLPHLVEYVFNLAIGISGLLAFGVLIYSGIRYLTSVGNPGTMKDAQDRIRDAFLGLIILLCSWIILNTINPDLIDIQTPHIESQTTQSTNQ